MCEYEIEVYNRKLHTMMKTADNVKIIQANLSRNHLTLHGLHLNISGKVKMAELIRGKHTKSNGKKRKGPHHSEMGRKSIGSY